LQLSLLHLEESPHRAAALLHVRVPSASGAEHISQPFWAQHVGGRRVALAALDKSRQGDSKRPAEAAWVLSPREAQPLAGNRVLKVLYRPRHIPRDGQSQLSWLRFGTFLVIPAVGDTSHV
jgi:hypothetical protein